MNFVDKLLGVLLSRRFWAAVGSVLTVLFQEVLGLTPEQANAIIAILIGWIVGDSVNKTQTMSATMDRQKNLSDELRWLRKQKRRG